MNEVRPSYEIAGDITRGSSQDAPGQRWWCLTTEYLDGEMSAEDYEAGLDSIREEWGPRFMFKHDPASSPTATDELDEFIIWLDSEI